MSEETSANPLEREEIHRRAASTSPELIIGLVGAIGTDLGAVAQALSKALMEESNYTARTIRLSSLLHELEGLGPLSRSSDKYVYYAEHMRAGTEFRRKLNRPDAMARLALSEIRQARDEMLMDEPMVERRAFILHSLKRKEEVASLRKVYGPAFFLVSVYGPREKRVDRLAHLIAESRGQWRPLDFRSEAEQLVRTDEKELDEPLGQDVQGAFPEADVFIDATNLNEMDRSVKRFVHLIFGHKFHTPTRSEWGMFFAKAAAVRSAALGRQVGSAITTQAGELVAVGTNEVPKAGGGLYWEGDEPDGRDFILGEDMSDRHKHDLIAELLLRLKEQGWLSEKFQGMEVQRLREHALRKDATGTGPWRISRLMNLIEFMRPVHAEMAALMEAVRRGVSVQGGVMYVTTFPCHECARHLIAGGLSRVVYVDPYPKSLAAELYEDSIALEGATSGSTGKVVFAPFVGVAPRRYMEFFELRGERKQGDGSVVTWTPAHAAPKYPGDYTVYWALEAQLLEEFAAAVQRVGLRFRAPLETSEEDSK